MFKQAWKTWDSFWFHSLDLYNVALMRMLISIIWVIMYSIRLLDFEIFYTFSGVLPVHLVDQLVPKLLQSPFPFYLQDDLMLLGAHWLFLVLLMCLAAGIFGRSLTWLVFILHVGFLQRNPGLVYGADLFSTFWLLGLSFVDHNRYFSIWNLRKKKVSDNIKLPRIDSDWVSTIGVRLIQVQICFVYAFTGIEKLKGDTWWEGTALWKVASMKDLLQGDYTFLYNFPILVACMTLFTLIFEVYFPAAVMNRGLRPYWLGVGVVFHMMTGVFMGIPFFALVMTLPYLLFIDPKQLRFFIHKVESTFHNRLKAST